MFLIPNVITAYCKKRSGATKAKIYDAFFCQRNLPITFKKVRFTPISSRPNVVSTLLKMGEWEAIRYRYFKKKGVPSDFGVTKHVELH